MGQIKRKEAEEARKKEAEEEHDFGTLASWDFGILFGQKQSLIVSQKRTRNEITFSQEVQCTLSVQSLRPSAMVASPQSPLVRITSLPSTFWS